MMKKAVLSPDAAEDLYEIGNFIARDNFEQAMAMLDKFAKAIADLGEFPGIGTAREELGERLRSLPVGKYLVFYRPTAEGLEVVRILHGARNLRRIFKRT